MLSTTELLAILKKTDPQVTRDNLTYLVRKGLLAPAARGPGKGRPRLWDPATADFVANVLRYRAQGYTWPGAAKQAHAIQQQSLPFALVSEPDEDI